jgi:hypothetical protein
MICPKCKSEYREGFVRCADCGVELVADLDSEDITDETSENELVSMLETEDSSFLADAVAAIEEAKIPYLLQSGTALGIDSLIPSDSLVWRAVLYAPSQMEEQIEGLIAKVKADRAVVQEEGQSD